jgi:hypothetical protein
MMFPAAEVFSLMYCGLRFRDAVCVCVVSHAVNEASEGYTAYMFRAECKDRGSMTLQNHGAHRRVKNAS